MLFNIPNNLREDLSVALNKKHVKTTVKLGLDISEDFMP